MTVLVLGAATDVASALLTDPGWADRISVVAMGFDGYPRGGDPWNVKNDPIAWRILLDSQGPDRRRRRRGHPKKALRMTPDRAHTLLAQLPDPAKDLLARFDLWIGQNARLAQNDHRLADRLADLGRGDGGLPPGDGHDRGRGLGPGSATT